MSVAFYNRVTQWNWVKYWIDTTLSQMTNILTLSLGNWGFELNWVDRLDETLPKTQFVQIDQIRRMHKNRNWESKPESHNLRLIVMLPNCSSYDHAWAAFRMRFSGLKWICSCYKSPKIHNICPKSMDNPAKSKTPNSNPQIQNPKSKPPNPKPKPQNPNPQNFSFCLRSWDHVSIVESYINKFYITTTHRSIHPVWTSNTHWRQQ